MLLLRKSLSKIYHRNNSVPSKQPLSLDLHSSSLFTNVNISWFLNTLTRSHLINAIDHRCLQIFSDIFRIDESERAMQCCPLGRQCCTDTDPPSVSLSPPPTWAEQNCCTATHYWTLLTPHHPHHRASSRQAK